jgi:hypothetical protein
MIPIFLADDPYELEGTSNVSFVPGWASIAAVDTCQRPGQHSTASRRYLSLCG